MTPEVTATLCNVRLWLLADITPTCDLCPLSGAKRTLVVPVVIVSGDDGFGRPGRWDIELLGRAASAARLRSMYFRGVDFGHYADMEKAPQREGPLRH